MNTLLFGIILSALFSSTSLLVVLLRVSPLTAPAQAIPAFFLSFFLTVSTVGALCFIGIWRMVPTHMWDMGKLTSISLRQGILLGISLTVIILFHQLNLLNWWIGILIVAVSVLVEVALDH
ncbi:MAG: hypothetical protein QF400_00145 [Candidatus Peribacteraceae bacterium]|jgi:hypothetical protein|nr:hypothetical protein [Candidatus Peribacteraceae bacterium]